jgi:pilus assembly protein Flp/PilA
VLGSIRRAVGLRNDAASRVEYGLLAAAVVALLVLFVLALSGYVRGVFDDSCTSGRHRGAGLSTAGCGAR